MSKAKDQGRRSRNQEPVEGRYPHDPVELKQLRHRVMGHFGLADVEEEIAFQFAIALNASSRAWRSFVDRRLRTINQSHASHAALMQIALSDTITTQDQIAARLGIEGPSLVAMLNRLEQEGLARRVPIPGNRRAKSVEIVEEAAPAISEIFRTAIAARADMLKGVDRDELAVCITVLHQIYRNTVPQPTGDDE